MLSLLFLLIKQYSYLGNRAVLQSLACKMLQHNSKSIVQFHSEWITNDTIIRTWRKALCLSFKT